MTMESLYASPALAAQIFHILKLEIPGNRGNYRK